MTHAFEGCWKKEKGTDLFNFLQAYQLVSR